MLELVDIHKRFPPDSQVIDGVTLTVGNGEIVCLLGPSGCGKTTLLRIIAGLETADSGLVRFGGEDLAGVPVHRRRFGLMFQDYALFPHMTVGRNVAFGLRMANLGQAAIEARVEEMLDLVDLHEYAGRSVDELSGGEQQRVALARTLAPSPRLVLLDEPLANLDRQLREELVEDLRAIVKHVGVTTVFVTHDQQEAFALADRLAVMNQGRVEQEGTPQAVHRHPATTFVARFLGFHNLIPAVAEEDHVRTPIGVFHLPPEQMAALRQRPSLLLIRPDAGALLSGEPPHGAHVLRGRVTGASFRGNVYRVHMMALEDPTLPVLSFELATHATDALPAVGESLNLLLDTGRMTVVRA